MKSNRYSCLACLPYLCLHSLHYENDRKSTTNLVSLSTFQLRPLGPHTRAGGPRRWRRFSDFARCSDRKSLLRLRVNRPKMILTTLFFALIFIIKARAYRCKILWLSGGLVYFMDERIEFCGSDIAHIYFIGKRMGNVYLLLVA